MCTYVPPVAGAAHRRTKIPSKCGGDVGEQRREEGSNKTRGSVFGRCPNAQHERILVVDLCGSFAITETALGV